MTLDRFLALIGIVVSLFLGLYTFAPEGWPKIPGWLILLGLVVGLVTLGLGLGLMLAKWKLAKPDFELVFDPTDPRFHNIGGDRVRFSVALRNVSDRTIMFPSVQTPDTEFANQIFTEANPYDWTRQVGAMRIFVGGDLDPQAQEFIPLFDWPTRGERHPLLNSSHRFTLEARGRDAKTLTVEFEYTPLPAPRLRKL